MGTAGSIAGVIVIVVGVFVLIRLVVNLFSIRLGIKIFLKNRVNPDPRCLENPKYGTVSGSAASLKIVGRKGDTAMLQWGDIEEVYAFKRDLISVDQICLVFKKTGTELHYEINEEMAGYYDLLQNLPKHLPNFNMDWIFDVASPAFATNQRIVWKRSFDATVQAVTSPAPRNS